MRAGREALADAAAHVCVLADTEVGIIEAMKMHIPVAAERTGRVAKWLVSENSPVAEGEPLLELEPV